MATQIQSALNILRRKQVEARVGLSRSFIYDAMSRNAFPRQVHLGRHAVGWLEHEIDAWLEARVRENYSVSK